LIAPTLKARGMKPRKGYADGGAPEDDLPDVGEPLIGGGPQISAGQPWANKAADIGSQLGYGAIKGIGDLAMTPGAVMKPNPYPEGSEDAAWYDNERAKKAADWAPDMAMTMVGGAGAVPAKANTLRSGLGAKFKNQAAMAQMKFAKDTDRRPLGR
jgi:hypothetical protein